MIRLLAILSTLILLSACARAGFGAGGTAVTAQQRPLINGVPQGLYIRPEYLAPAPTPLIPPVDACRSRLYAGLVGQHEGAIHIPGLPGRKRVLKPAFLEGFDYQPDDSFYSEPPFVEVRDYLPQQVLYAPAIRTVTDRISLGPEDENRLTIELDREGYVQEIRCE